MTGQLKITNRIGGWDAVAALNESCTIKIGQTYHPPLGRGRGRKLRMQQLRQAWNTAWKAVDMINARFPDPNSSFRETFIVHIP